MSNGKMVRKVRQKTMSDIRGITDSVIPPEETTAVGAPPPTAFLPIDGAAETSTTLAPAPSEFLPIDEPGITTAPTAPQAPPPSNFLPVETSPQPVPATSAFIPINPIATTTTTPSVNFLTLNPATTTPVYVHPYCSSISDFHISWNLQLCFPVLTFHYQTETVQSLLALLPPRTFYRWTIQILLQLL